MIVPDNVLDNINRMEELESDPRLPWVSVRGNMVYYYATEAEALDDANTLDAKELGRHENPKRNIYTKE